MQFSWEILLFDNNSPLAPALLPFEAGELMMPRYYPEKTNRVFCTDRGCRSGGGRVPESVRKYN